MHFFRAGCFKHKTPWSDSVCSKGPCLSANLCPSQALGCVGKNGQCLVGLRWTTLVFGQHWPLSWCFSSMAGEVFLVYIWYYLDFGYSEISRGNDEWIKSVNLVRLLILLHLQCDLLTAANDSVKYELLRIHWPRPRGGWWRGCQGRFHGRATFCLPPALAFGSVRCRRACCEFDVTSSGLEALRHLTSLYLKLILCGGHVGLLLSMEKSMISYHLDTGNLGLSEVLDLCPVLGLE